MLFESDLKVQFYQHIPIIIAIEISIVMTGAGRIIKPSIIEQIIFKLIFVVEMVA